MPNIHSSISFALVSIPVILNPIIKNNDISFNQLHKKCLKRIKYIKYCPTCKKELKESDIIKGYPYLKDNYVIFNKEELDNLKLEQEQEIEVISFVKESEIPIWYYDKSYFLNTEKKSKSYTLFCEALKKSKKVAVAKTIIGTKFYYCILKFIGNGILLTTLYFEEEVKLYDADLNKKITEKELELAMKLIDEMSSKFEPSKYKDEYVIRIRKAIDDKLDGKKVTKSKKTNKKEIDNLLKSLERSINRKK